MKKLIYLLPIFCFALLISCGGESDENTGVDVIEAIDSTANNKKCDMADCDMANCDMEHCEKKCDKANCDKADCDKKCDKEKKCDKSSCEKYNCDKAEGCTAECMANCENPENCTAMTEGDSTETACDAGE